MKNGPYILVIAPAGYPGKKYRNRYVYEHQLVWWLHTKIIPPCGYQIHHKNANKHDNNFSNLELVFKSTHSKLHGKEKHKRIILLICDWCMQPFSRETRNYKVQIAKGQKFFHCTRSCQVHTQQRLLRRSSVGS